MKKSTSLLALTLLLPFIAILAPTIQAQDSPTYGKDITIWSPTNRTYNTEEAIRLEATSKNLEYHLHSASYKLDGTIYTLYNKENQSQARDPSFGTLFGCLTLPKLAEGQHKLTVHLQIVYAPVVGDFVEEVTVYFSVSNPPNITLHSLDREIFNQPSVPLNFTIDKLASLRTALTTAPKPQLQLTQL